MMVLQFALTLCSALTLASNGVIGANNEEFGRAAPVILKRRSDARAFRSHGASFGFNRRKRHFTAPDDDPIPLSDLELSELERELRLDDMSLSMSFEDSANSPSAPSTGTGNSNPSNPGNPSTPTSMNNPSSTPPPSPSAANGPTSSPVFMTSPTTLFPTFVTTTSTQTPSIADTNADTNTDTMPSDGTLDPSKTMAPTFIEGPTATNSPTSELVPSPAPTSPLPSITPTTVFDLAPGTRSVGIIPPPHGDTTVVRIEIEYIVEGFVESTEEFEDDLDGLIFITSVMAALAANDTGALEQLASNRRLEAVPTLMDGHRNLLSNSYFLRPCNATTIQENCFIMGADVVFILNGERNADFDAYLAYLALNSEMSSFDDDVPNVTRVEYLSPLPILPPVSLEDQESSTDNLLTPGGNSLSVNPIAVGATVGMSVFGLLALLAWSQNRRTRDRRHHQLVEEASLQPSSSNYGGGSHREVVSHPI
ncbi:expressed unknown protein [Seminavis robusta]|uniref:Uncharacterized protein n=1 Tax=Seminavis robusta TaxID=568900 RepID=A0A9N8EI10_9STRA|nr:expressed unknown protein [Seminavis robusta]|eukprot:Sro1224_g253950.1 n/a (480) ;mRNA; f:4014-5608